MNPRNSIVVHSARYVWRCLRSQQCGTSLTERFIKIEILSKNSFFHKKKKTTNVSKSAIRILIIFSEFLLSYSDVFLAVHLCVLHFCYLEYFFQTCYFFFFIQSRNIIPNNFLVEPWTMLLSLVRSQEGYENKRTKYNIIFNLLQ